MKTECSLGYCHNGFVVTHDLGHIMSGYTLLGQRVPQCTECSNLTELRWV